MSNNIHILWPEEVWELWGEREAKKEGRWTIENARVAVFTTHNCAVNYLTSCELNPQEPPIGLSLSLLMAQLSGRACPPRNPFAEDSLLTGWERAFITKAAVLPVDPVYINTDEEHYE